MDDTTFAALFPAKYFPSLQLDGMRRCRWLRLACGHCGEYTAIVEAGQADGAERCAWCGAGADLVAEASGHTRQTELPFVSRPVVVDATCPVTEARPGPPKPRRRGTRWKLTDADRAEIRRRRRNTSPCDTLADLALAFNVSVVTICTVLRMGSSEG